MTTEKQIALLDDYPEDGIFEITLNNKSLLLVIQNRKAYLIENKCGHFGVPLKNGCLRGNDIVCAEHGISFDLETGQIVNRPYENCEPIKVFPLKQVDNRIFLITSESQVNGD